MSTAVAPPIIVQPEMLTIQCAWCLAVKVDGTYRRCPAIPLMDSLSDNVSHGICGECRAHLTLDMTRMLD